MIMGTISHDDGRPMTKLGRKRCYIRLTGEEWPERVYRGKR